MYLTNLPFLVALIGQHAFASPELERTQLGSAVIAGINARSETLGQISRLSKRATTDYQPYQVQCPSNLTWIRDADSLSSGEQSYLQQRQSYLTAIDTMVEAHGVAKPPRTPVIGIALSGGGYRAMT